MAAETFCKRPVTSVGVVYLMLFLQCLVPVASSKFCYGKSDCSFFQNCCFGRCTVRDHCDGSCSNDYECDVSKSEHCCNSFCQAMRCDEDENSAPVIIGLSIAGFVAFIIGIVVCVGCACRTRRGAPGRVVNRRILQTRTTTTRGVPVSTGRPVTGYQNQTYPNQQYQEFPQLPRYQPPTTFPSHPPPISSGYQRGGFQSMPTTYPGVGVPPPPYSEVARGANKTLYAPRTSYGAVVDNSLEPSAPPTE